MPDIAGAWLPSPQVVGDEGAELNRPAPDRFIRNVYATFQHHLLHLAQTQVEPDVEPNSMSNDLGRKPVVLVVDFLCLHQKCLPPDQSARNLRPVNVTTPAKPVELIEELRGLGAMLLKGTVGLVGNGAYAYAMAGMCAYDVEVLVTDLAPQGADKTLGVGYEKLRLIPR